MQDGIGATAGAIWHALEKNGETTVSSLKKEIDASSPVFDWAIGWLAREHKIILTKDNRSWLIRLEGQGSSAAGKRKAPAVSNASGSSS